MKKFLLAALLLIACAIVMGYLLPTVQADDPELADEYVPTYYTDIKPLLETHCLACHAQGGIGAEVVRLDDQLTVQERAEDITFVTSNRTMPPWLPGEDSPPLQHERKLSEDEIFLLKAWFNASAPLGDAEQAVTADVVPLPSITPDLVVEMPEPYTPDASRDDDYRCFLLDPHLTQDTFIKGYQVEPQQISLVHHVLVFNIPAATKSRAIALDNADDRLGWECFGDTGSDDDNVVGTWAPGGLPVYQPEGMGYPLKAGDLFIIQVHYFLQGGAKPDQTRVLFDLAEDGEELQTLTTTPLLAPVEIPCPANDHSPACTRQAALERATRYDPGNARLVDGLLRLCHKTPEDYANQDAANVISQCDNTMPFDILLVEVLPHMHTRGTSIRVERNPDTPDAQILIDIPVWDFHWQGSFQYQTPIRLNKGDVVRLTCVWDNTQELHPRYIVWGEGTDDEMCLAYITLLPIEE